MVVMVNGDHPRANGAPGERPAVCRRRDRRERINAGVAAASLMTLAIVHGSLVDGWPGRLEAAGLAWLAVAPVVSLGVRLPARRATARSRRARDDDPEAARRDAVRRERRRLETAWLWYVAPTVPGFALLYGGMSARPEPVSVIAIGLAVTTLGFLLAVALVNRRAGARLAVDDASLDADAARGP